MSRSAGRTPRSRSLARCIRALVRFHRDQSGSTLALFTVAMVATLGMAGLGFDATIWYLSKRQSQTVADNSVLAGASVLTKGGSVSEVRRAVIDGAARNGFVHGVDGEVIANVPPRFGPNAGDANFVEVFVIQQVPPYFTAVLAKDPVEIQARAVGSLKQRGQHCVLALDPTMDAAVEFSGNVEADIGCGVASNSSSKQSILVDGSASLQADPAQAYGDILVKGNGSMDSEAPPQSLSERLEDPYEDIVIPEADPDCDAAQPQGFTGTVILTPGNYCGGVTFTNAEVTFEAGVYVIDSGDFATAGSTDLEGEGVTFFFTSAEPDRIGGLAFSGDTDAGLIAPGPDGHESGPYEGRYAGMLFVQDPDAPASQGGGLVQNKILGGSETDLRGAIYFPNQEVVFSGGSDEYDGCLQIVARKVTFSGDATINNDAQACAEQGVTTIAQTRIRLVE